MHRIAKVGFETVPLMNREELGVFTVLKKLVAERRDSYRLMAQTSLGEIIRPKQGFGSKEDRDLAFRSINGKRLDFAIFDRSGRLALAIEYQGSGHYHEKSFMRDAVKKEALRKAGVPLLEVPVRFDGISLLTRSDGRCPGNQWSRNPRADRRPAPPGAVRRRAAPPSSPVEAAAAPRRPDEAPAGVSRRNSWAET